MGRNNTPASQAHIQSTPRVRQEHSAEYEDLKIPDSGQNAYAKVASKDYLNSEAIVTLKKRKKRRKIMIGLSISLLVALVVGIGAAYAYMSKISDTLSYGLDESLFDALTSTDTPEDPFYVLLLGVDGSLQREKSGFGSSYRSDSMMLVRVDPKNKKAAMVSIPRDSQVDLGKYGKEKINAAHFFGGPTLSVQIVSKLTGVPISHYAEINFDGFCAVIDALGGVDVEVPIEINDKLAGGHVDAGFHRLNGEEALILCRSRHSYDEFGDGDEFRAANQRLVLSALAQKILSSDAVTIANSIEKLSDSVLTDMKVEEIIAIAQNLRGMNAELDIYSATLPTTSEYKNETWWQIIDEKGWKTMIQRVDSGLPPTAEDIIDSATGTILASAGNATTSKSAVTSKSASIRIRNGNGTDGVCADVQRKLEEVGYTNFDVGNADNFNYDETIVIYKDDKLKSAAEEIVQALGVGESVKDTGKYLFESDFLIVVGADWSL